MRSMWKNCAEALARCVAAVAVTGAAIAATIVIATFSASTAFAAPVAVETFDKATWPSLVRTTKQPAIVVFTSVTCTHCPGAIANLAKQRAQFSSGGRSPLPLLVVSIDAEDDAALLRDVHYAPADRLFAFRGSMQALQYAVNPEWRGMTPYVAFIDGRGAARFVLGEPKAAVLQGWLKGR